MRKICILFGLLSLATVSFATETLPKSCQPLTLKGREISLKSKDSSVFFLQNVGNNSVWFSTSNNKGASAGWSSKLDKGQWSALLLSHKNLAFQCVESQPGHEQMVSCQGLIQVCQWNKAGIPKKMNGSFWLAENNPLKNIISQVRQRGVVLN